MGISGAAVATGLGSRTSLSLSLLIGLCNFRLGQWWRSGIEIEGRKASSSPSVTAKVARWVARFLPVQMHLFNELLARFPGTSSKDWYLTDGGHFENTGAYELIRRRLRTIIVCDNGADAERSFQDLADLVRKVRVDFGARVEFLPHSKLPDNGKVLGTLADLGFREARDAEDLVGEARGKPSKRPSRYAALARITYEDPDDSSILLWLRPAVLGSEPTDVLGYHATNKEFPQQSTADQFFDEAQWESYRRLGEEMAHTVLSQFPASNSPAANLGWRLVDRKTPPAAGA
jgi:hypothetical protein